MNSIINKCINIASTYKIEGYHCSESIIRAINEGFELHLSKEMIRSACGFRGGGGGYHDRCGIIDAGIMIISYLYGRDDLNKERWTYSYLIRVLHDRFKEEFNSIYCRDIMLPQKEKGIENICLDTTKIGTKILAELLIEAPELLKNIKEEDKN